MQVVTSAGIPGSYQIAYLKTATSSMHTVQLNIDILFDRIPNFISTRTSACFFVCLFRLFVDLVVLHILPTMETLVYGILRSLAV